MPRLSSVVAILLLSAACRAQDLELVPTWTAISGELEKPAQWLETSTKPIQSVYVKGHWKSLDKNNPVAGFSVSEISCSKPGLDSQDGGCTEEAASVTPVLGWQLVPDYNEYKIVSWRDDGMTARYIGGTCKISHTLEIDFKDGSVLITDAPTKMNKIESCNIPASTYQLMDGEGFSVVKKKAAAKS